MNQDRFGWIINRIKENEKILDVGCADARVWKLKELYGSPNLTLVDINLYRHPNFVRADAHFLPFQDKSYDVVVLGEILEHVDYPVKVLKEARRVARQRVIISVPDEENWIDLYKPFTPVDEILIEMGVSMEQHAAISNPEVVDFCKDLSYLYHKRHYTRDLLEQHLSEAGITHYEIEHLMYEGWSFFMVESKLEEVR